MVRISRRSEAAGEAGRLAQLRNAW